MGISWLRQSTELEKTLCLIPVKMSRIWCKTDASPESFGGEGRVKSWDQALQLFMERLWTTFRWDQPPPDGCVGDQDDSAPSMSTSGVFMDQDEPERFSASGKTGFLSEEINLFTKNSQTKTTKKKPKTICSCSFFAVSLRYLRWETTKLQLFHLCLQQCGRKKS